MATRTEIIHDAIIQSYKGGHRDVAKVFCLLYGHRIRVKLLKRTTPSVFTRKSVTDAWEGSSIIEIRNMISDEFSKHYEAIGFEVFLKAYNENGEIINHRHLDIAIALIRVSRLLKTATYKAIVAKEIIEILFEN